LFALSKAGWPDGARPPPIVDEVRRIADDLPFQVPDDRRDAWAIALLIGVRDNDLRGEATNDLPALAAVHGDPAHQADHCLRAPADDGSEGDVSALAACRAFILDQVERALGESEDPDLETRESVQVA